MPKFRKLKVASTRMALPNRLLAKMIIGVVTLGKIWENIIWKFEAPKTREAETNSCFFTTITLLRTTLQ